MNKIILMLLCSLISAAPVVAQKSKEQTVTIPSLPVDPETGLYTYEKVVEVPGATKNEMFNRALAWANGFYKNPSDVLREKDLKESRILIKARFRISNEPDKKGTVTPAGDVMYSLTFNFKDGKYKYEITKINWQDISYYPIERWKNTEAPSFKPAFAYYLKQTDEEIKSVISDFTKKIAEPAQVKNNDDW